MSGNDGFQLLQLATNALLSSADVAPRPTLLWSIQYEQRADAETVVLPTHASDHALLFPPVPLDLASVDSALDHVKGAWRRIMGDEVGEFLVFADRETYDDDE